MSSRKHPLDGADDESSSSQKRQHIAPPSPTPAAASEPPAVSRLFDNALHCIFAFLQLDSLCAVVLVSKSWCSAVNSVGPASVGCAKITDRYHSRLLHLFLHKLQLNRHKPFDQPATGVAKHVTKLTNRIGEWKSLLPALVQLWPNLRILSAWLPTDSAPPSFDFAFPLRLRELELYDDQAGEQTNDIFKELCRLPDLVRFTLMLQGELPLAEGFYLVNFALLHEAPKLTDFVVNFREPSQPSRYQQRFATDQQVADLRALPHQLILPCHARSNPNLATRLLQPPHTLRYECIERPWGNHTQPVLVGSKRHASLRHLPSLTVLGANLRDVPDEQMDFLTPLVNLTELYLCDSSPREISPAFLLPSLPGMTRLTKLTLECKSLTSDHLTQLLPHIPLLKELTLEDCENVRSLLFLSSSPSLSKTLTQLELLACPIAPDPAPFSTLHALTRLIVGCRDRSIPNAAESPEWRHFSPPSRIMPNLRELVLVFPRDLTLEEEEEGDFP